MADLVKYYCKKCNKVFEREDAGNTCYHHCGSVATKATEEQINPPKSERVNLSDVSSVASKNAYRYDEDKTVGISEYYSNSNSGLGSAIKTMGIVLLILSIIGSFGAMTISVEIGISALLGSVVACLLIMGLGECICLLNKINYNLERMRK